MKDLAYQKVRTLHVSGKQSITRNLLQGVYSSGFISHLFLPILRIDPVPQPERPRRFCCSQCSGRGCPANNAESPFQKDEGFPSKARLQSKSCPACRTRTE